MTWLSYFLLPICDYLERSLNRLQYGKYGTIKRTRRRKVLVLDKSNFMPQMMVRV